MGDHHCCVYEDRREVPLQLFVSLISTDYPKNRLRICQERRCDQSKSRSRMIRNPEANSRTCSGEPWRSTSSRCSERIEEFLSKGIPVFISTLLSWNNQMMIIIGIKEDLHGKGHTDQQGGGIAATVEETGRDESGPRRVEGRETSPAKLSRQGRPCSRIVPLLLLFLVRIRRWAGHGSSADSRTPPCNNQC